MKTRPFALLAFGACLLAGHPCFVSDSRAEAAASSAASAPPADKKETIAYRIARDKIIVAVAGEPELNAIIRVDVNGNINLGLIGDVHVEGLTRAEAQTAIENKYREERFLRNPQVTVNIDEYAPRNITVNGLVKTGGISSLPPETTTTLKDVINRAQLQETANAKAVRISRPQPDGTTKYFYKNIEGILKAKDTGNSADANFVIEPGDTIYVPEKIF